MRYPNIEAERARKGVTLDEFAEHLGVTRKTAYNWMQSGRIPLKKLEKMSQYHRWSFYI